MKAGLLLSSVSQVFGQDRSQRTNVLELDAAAAADDLNASVHAGERPFDELLGRHPLLQGLALGQRAVLDHGVRVVLGRDPGQVDLHDQLRPAEVSV